jgi:tetratricopeptide (TPR) repeat protein
MRKTIKNKVREFQPNFLEKIRDFIDNDQYDKAESTVKKALKVNISNNNFKSSLYSLLGEISYIKGNYPSSKRFYKISLDLNPKNENTIYNIANTYLYEQNYEKALPYIKKNLKNNPRKVKYLYQYLWYLVMAGDNKNAEILYKKLLKSNKIDPQGFVDISMTLVSRGEFDKARRIIFAAIGKFPESFLVEDAMLELSEIEINFHNFRKDIYFKRLNELGDNSKLYLIALRKLVEGMSIRGYFKFEIEKSTDLLIDLTKTDYKFPTPELLAALSELIISESVGDYDQLFQNISNFYGTSVYILKKWYNLLKEEKPELIHDIISKLLFVYNEEFDEILSELEEDKDD